MYIMQKTNFNKYTNTIVRESNNGKTNLIYHVDSQTALKHPQIPDSDYTNTVEHFVTKKKKNKPIISRFSDSTVSNEIFKSENPEIYQGFQRGEVMNRLPQSWLSGDTKQYNPNIGGASYNDGSGKTQTQDNFREMKTPVLGQQWGRINKPNGNPNPFPIRINENIKIK